MTGFAHRLLGHTGPPGTIQPVVKSLFEPAPATPGELNLFEDATEFTAAPRPDQPAAGRATGKLAIQADADSRPAPAAAPSWTDMPVAARPHDEPPPAGPLPAPSARRSASLRRAHHGQTHPPPPPADGVPEAALPHGAGEPPPPAAPPTSRRLLAMAQLPKIVQLTTQASHQDRMADPAGPQYPAFPAAGAPAPGTVPVLAAGRPVSPASSRPGNHPRPGPGQPDVHITIGRIDVRAVPEPARATRQEPRRPAAPTLRDYLRGRDGQP
jgi:hypothetical protein